MNLGIIAEYNPFHNGHKFHIEQSKKITNCENVIVVMSGNFVQRGEPAIIDKYLRSKLALLNGADIVIELPVYFATGGADVFSMGSVDLLNKMNIIDFISFGSECGDINKLTKISNTLTNETPDFKKTLKMFLKKGLSYPLARAETLKFILDTDDIIINEPNNILGVEYIKSLNILNSNIKPFTIPRNVAHFNSKNIYENIASATAIRNVLKNNSICKIEKCVPYDCKNIFNNLNNIENYNTILNFILKTTSAEKLSNISDITEGLENRILNNSNIISINELIDCLKTKRYTHAKLRRAILHILLDITKSEINILSNNNYNKYIRVLGFKKEKEYLIKSLCKNSQVPVITNIKNAKNQLSSLGLHVLKKEIETTDIYYINNNKNKNYEYKKQLVIV